MGWRHLGCLLVIMGGLNLRLSRVIPSFQTKVQWLKMTMTQPVERTMTTKTHLDWRTLPGGGKAKRAAMNSLRQIRSLLKAMKPKLLNCGKGWEQQKTL